MSYWAVGAVQGDVTDFRLVTRNVGEISGQTLSSRKVLINSFIEDQLYREGAPKRLYKKTPQDVEFASETSAVLIEMGIAKEGQNLPLGKVSESEFQKERQKFLGAAKQHSAWIKLGVSPSEVDEVLRVKMSAKKLIRFRVDAVSLEVTDSEARTYFEKNRFKFDNQPFEKFKANIKSYLVKQHVDSRLREWFEALKIKFGIRNHLSES